MINKETLFWDKWLIWMHNSVFFLMLKVKDLIKQAESTFGPVDILVNNAAYFAFTLMKNVLEDEWDKMIDVNCKVSYLLFIFFKYF